MILTLYYMYATIVQWWRLGILKNKLSGTLNSHNALLVCTNANFVDKKRKRCLENLLAQKEDRLACTIVPKQVLDLSHWAMFPKDYKYFPIYIKKSSFATKSPKVYVLVQTNLDSYIPHQSDVIEIENYGELVAWRAEDTFELILKTDLDNLTKFAFSYCDHSIDINHELQLLKIETVDIVGTPTKIKYEQQYSLENRLKYSLAPLHWRKFVEDVRNIYSKVSPNDQPKLLEHPRITIESSNKPEEFKKVPISEVKPIKKEHHRKSQSAGRHEDEKIRRERNKLEVTSGTTKRSKSSEHKNRDDKDYERREHRKKEFYKSKDAKEAEKLLKEKEKRHDLSKEVPTVNAVLSETTKVKEVEEEDKKTHREDDKKAHKNEIVTDKSKLSTHKHRKDHGERVRRDDKSKSYTKLKDKHSKDSEAITETTKPEENKYSKLEESTETDSQVKESNTENVAKLKSRSSEERRLKRELSFEEKDLPCEAKTNGSVTAYSNEVQIEVPAVKDASPSKPDLKHIKPPNVLVFADSSTTRDNVKNVLHTILNKNRYTLYDFPVECTDHLVWSESTGLLVVCGSVPSNLTSQMLHFLLTGGQVLCMCSDLLYSVLHCFSTAEVREHELVRFSYGNWKQVRMMHHVFCYQASPAKKQFSKDSDQSSQSNGSRGSSPVAPRMPSSVEIQHNGKKYTLQIQVLGTEETWQTPSLLLTSIKNSSGRAIFSQVHLEIDPTEYEDDESKYAALKDSNQARLEILKHILSYHLEIDCTNETGNVEYTPGYFLGRHDLKLKVLNESECIKDNILECEKITLKFCGKDEKPGPSSATRMPIYILACPSNFSTVHYFETLNTEHIGRLVVYSDIMTSSQHLLSKELVHGIVVIPRQQTSGIGRSGNTWLSPMGCAMFSLQFHVPLDSLLGKYLPLMQHLIMVSIVSAVRSMPGYEDLEIGLKWPNDLYINKTIKIGGSLVTTFVKSNMAILNIGVGLNLDNSEPTACLNDLIKTYNEENNRKLPLIGYEKYFAYVFNELEKIYKIMQNGNLDYFYDLYYKYWLHSGVEVTIATTEKDTSKATIIGIDDYGFLKVTTENGKIISVQPDGNTFNMLTGLISPKTF